MKKNFIPFIALAGVLLATSCGKDYSNSMFALSYNLSDPNMSGLWKPGLEAASVAAGYDKIELADAKNDDTEALKLVEAACVEDYAAYLLNVVNETNGQTYVNKVKETGKPAIFWNRKISKAALTSYEKAYYVGIEAAEGGRYQGAMAGEYIKANGGVEAFDKGRDNKIGVLVVRGEKGHADAEARTLNAPLYLEKTLGNADATATVSGTNYTGTGFTKVEVVGIVDGTSTSGTAWDAETAQTEVERVLTDAETANKVDIVLSNNDGMALGILKGTTFKEKKLPIWGVDALADAITAIKAENSQFKGTVRNDGVAQAKVCVDAAKNLIKGKAVTDGMTVVTTKAEWEANPNSYWYDAAEKSILVHHAKITKANA